MGKFFHTITHLHPIKFTKETEQDNQLAYLDVLVKRNNNNELETAVFRKKTHTGLYTKFSSLCSNLIACLLHRAYQICSSYEINYTEFDNITHMLLLNGYPLSFIQAEIRKFLNERHNSITQSQSTDESSNQSSNRILFRLPYIRNQSITIEKEVRSFFRKYRIDKVRQCAIHDTLCIGDMFRFKDKLCTLRRRNVVNKLSCSCGSNYIGQTRRNLIIRLQEHNPKSIKSQNTDVTKHLADNPGHKINFDQPEILATAHNFKQLLIKETLLIHQHSPAINTDDSSTPLYLFNSQLSLLCLFLQYVFFSVY